MPLFERSEFWDFLIFLLLFVSRQKVKEGKFERIIFSQEMS